MVFAGSSGRNILVCFHTLDSLLLRNEEIAQQLNQEERKALCEKAVIIYPACSSFLKKGSSNSQILSMR
jgi:hypothetical protein